MANTPRQPSSSKRKRNQDDAAAAMPLRRSRRVAYREIFRLPGLPPEILNAVYSIAVRSKVSLELTGELSATAEALSQVSRAVRTESLGVYFSENDFHAYLSRRWNNEYLRANYYRSGIPKIEEWMALFGRLATPRLRSIQLRLGHNFLIRDNLVGTLDFANPHATVTWAVWDDLNPWSGSFGAVVKEYCKAGMEALALAVFQSQSQGNAVPTPKSLRLFLTGMQVVMERSKSQRRVGYAWLDLDSTTDLREYLPHMLY